jgi:oligosaccharide repeat unit polymerase
MMLNYSRGDVFFPANIVLIAFACSLAFAIMEMKKWDISISLNTVGVILIGLTSYVIGTVLASSFKTKIKSDYKMSFFKYRKAETFEESIPYIPKLTTVFVVIFDILILYKYFLDVRRSASYLGSFKTLGSMIGAYRNAGVSGELIVGISKISAYGYNIVTVFAYLYLYVLISQIVIKRKNIKDVVICLIPICLFGVCSILTGGRNPLIQIFVAAIMMYNLLCKKYKGANYKFNWKFVARMSIIVVIFLIMFSNIRSLVGRTNTMSTFDYLAMYIGAPIKLFDMFLEKPPTTGHTFWGQETFINLWAWWGSIVKDSRMTGLIMNKEYRIYKGIQLGNVYTAFREYYCDFGLVGIIILPMIHSLFFTRFYRKITKSGNRMYRKSFDISILIYSYLSVALAYYSIDDRLFQKFLSKGTFRELLFMFILAAILPRLQWKRMRSIKY